MQQVELSRLIAIKIWWSFYWRSILLMLGLTMGTTIVLGMLFALTGAKGDRLAAFISGVMGITSLPAFIIASIKGMEWTLKKKFSDFEIAVIPRQD